MDNQTTIIITRMAIHNYNKKCAKYDKQFDKADNEDDYMPFAISDVSHDDIMQEAQPNIVAQDNCFITKICEYM